MVLVWPAGVHPRARREFQLVPGGGALQASPYTGLAQASGSAVVLHAFEFDYPPLTAAQAQAVRAVIAQAAQDDVLLPIAQPGRLDLSGAGAPVVSATASGRFLQCSGFAAGYVMRAGQFIAVYSPGGDNPRLYTLAADSLSGASRTLSLTSVVRFPHAVNSQIGVDPPFMQGLIESHTFSVETAPLYGFTMRVREWR